MNYAALLERYTDGDLRLMAMANLMPKREINNATREDLIAFVSECIELNAGKPP